ncbi:MAG: DNA translocase FtsK 4TM domain-containing protein [Cytophagales bacterium]
MAQNTYKKNTPKVEENQPSPKKAKREASSDAEKRFFGFLNDRRLHVSFGFFLLFFSVYAFIASLSHLFTGNDDQSVVEGLTWAGFRSDALEVENWLGIAGAVLSHYFVFKWFGVSFFLTLPIIFSLGLKIIFGKGILPTQKAITVVAFFMFWLSLTLGYLTLLSGQEKFIGFLGGGVGYELAFLFNGVLGWGTFLFLFLSLLVFSVYMFNLTDFGKEQDVKKGKSKPKKFYEENEENENEDDSPNDDEEVQLNDDDEPIDEGNLDQEAENDVFTFEVKTTTNQKKNNTKPEFDFEIEQPKDEPIVTNLVQNKLIAQDLVVTNEKNLTDERIAAKIEGLENYDPKLDLSSFQYPTLDLLNELPVNKVQVPQEELKFYKDKIVETLQHYSIGITKILATVGPTVTLYEIVPDPGVRISKIKSLEDDIALSLSALGIRIIAPMPGKGTIGIEVPNKTKEMVPFRSVLGTEAFANTDKALPIVLGKTISNDVFIADLAAMPHLLMAGATGQGKSVGINVLIASLLYKMHPSQLKFVMVDPKKVELSLFNKLERHFLAKLPNNDEAIITDTKKVVNTLNSLCIEMDNRYELLKKANCRNIKEYNPKFIERKLLPTEGHRFLPYIVVIIDELADLMMTAGKEVETPIARLAQLARAIGIHLVVATQRPSVNVITGIIKANFPARLSFKVTSAVDSKTILDTSGANQLIGKGDMLFSNGSELTRIQCAFIDTPEVERLCNFIGGQRGYPNAYLLPEFSGEEGDGNGSGKVDLKDLDPMFEEAARLIVINQQGSTSLIQRKMSLGYNRAGRIMDQLEAAGIVGPFEGSKAREVYILDEAHLNEHLKSMGLK